MSGLNKKSNSVHENSNKIEKTPHLKESIKKYGRNLFGALMITASIASSQSTYAGLHNIANKRDSVSANKKTEIPKEDNKKTLREDKKVFSVDSIITSKKSGEIIQKSLEFEADYFKINSAGWKEVTEADSDDPILGKFVENFHLHNIPEMPRIKVNETGDVVEFLDGIAKGEQIFTTYDAFIREVMKAKNCTQEEVETKYLMTIDEFDKKRENMPAFSEKYSNFFKQEIEGHLSGLWDSKYKNFYNIGDDSGIWLVGGDAACFDKDRGYQMENGKGTYGFSGRLLKN